MSHSPIPWTCEATSNMSLNTHSVFADGKWILTTTEANAAFIVRTVNAHDGLLKALEEIAIGKFDDVDPDDGMHRRSVRAVAREALALAKGGAA